MDVNDEAEILSRLGILDSTLESPHKSAAKQAKADGFKYVDVDINGTNDSDDSEEDNLFDRETLLTTGSQRPRQRCEESWKCKFSLLFVTVFTVGAVQAAGFIGFSNALPSASSCCLGYSIGTLAGNVIGRIWFLRFNTSYLYVSALSMLLFTFSLSLDALNSVAFFTIIGFAIGALNYEVLSEVFVSSATSVKRRNLWTVYLVFALGALSLSFVATVNQSSLYDQMHISNIVREIRATESSSTLEPNISTLISVPKKPQIAIGAPGGPTKTDQNVLNRLDAEKSIVNSSSPSPISISTTTTTTTTTTTSTTTTTAASTSILPPTALNDLPLLSTGIRVTLISTSGFTLAFFLISSLLCCLSCRPFADAKVAKLNRVETFALTKGSRLRLHALFILYGLIEGLMIHSLVTSWSANFTGPTVASIDAVLRFFFLFVSGHFSLFWLWSLMLGAVGSTLLCAFQGFSSLAIAVTSGCLSSFAFLTVTYADQLLTPPPSSLLNAFVFSTSVGRLLLNTSLAVVSLSIEGQMKLTSGLAVLLVFVFFLLMRSLKKAYRFKIINDFGVGESTHPQGYTSLLTLNEDIPQLSDTEEDL